MGRRDFIGSMAADALTLAATVAGAASALRAASAGTAAALVAAPAPRPPAGGVPDATGSATADDAAGAAGGGPAGDPEAGFRPAFRLEGDALVLLDQRRLPDEVVEVRCRTADDVALAMRDLVVRGAPALGQVAAYGLALAAGRAADSPPWARGAMVAGAAATLRAARPTAVNVGWALDRLLARLAAEEQRQSDGPAIASALRTEADAVAAAATEDHLRMAGLGVGLLPWFADRPTRILTHCNTGPLACGRIGTALGVVQVAHADGRRVHVFVDETRPWLQGARLTAWELARAGVPCRILADAAAGWLLASGVVDAVLVGADRIAANGDTANKIGTYPLAALADRHGVPFYVVAPTASIDLDAPDGAAIPIETRAADEVLSIRGLRIAPAGVEALNPVFDVTPAELVTAIVTEAGVLRAPFGVALAAAVGARAGKRP
ncbi:MAG: S-methyl-5-thioribose-1-phosphate isomerase, partial [Chloroflexi bacterium]|nr:S-methyl-5-thioribose-1-phosphate isomerase [Chloroflexota bacterium]